MLLIPPMPNQPDTQMILRRPFERVSFSRQFILTGSVILLITLILIGAWLSRQIENSVVSRTTAIAAVYVESILAAQLRDWPGKGVVSSRIHQTLDSVFISGPLQRKVVRFKLWEADGQIAYSSDHTQMGQLFPMTEQLAAAFAGDVQSQVSGLNAEDAVPEIDHGLEFLKVYVPVRGSNDGHVMAVGEFHHSMENLGREIHAAQQRSWLLLALSALGIFAALFSLVRRANDTIVEQHLKLSTQLQTLRSTYEENERMRTQLQEAGAKTTALNEHFLRRIAADLHDGPAQDLAFSLLRFDEMTKVCSDCSRQDEETPRDFRAAHGALKSSLKELRTIAAGLGVPGIDALSLGDTVRRAVRDVERKVDTPLTVHMDQSLDVVGPDTPLATRITAYRLVQESLTNALRHAPGHAPELRVWVESSQLCIAVSDHGAGFDLTIPTDRLGLSFMRERVRLLGGVIEIDSAPGKGTRINARIPLSPIFSFEELHA